VQRPVADGKVEAIRYWGWSDEHRSWTWPGAEGKTVVVRVYTVGDRVELRLNGRTLDSKPVTAADLKRVEFTTTYGPGTLEALAFRNGVEIARKQLVTVGAPAAIRLTPEHAEAGAARGDINYVTVEIVDAEGRVVPDTTKNIQLSLSGPAELIAFGSANPVAVGSFQSPTAQTWEGRALAIVRGSGAAGRVKVEVRAEGLRSGSTMLNLA
jgi:beta-galactosidase